MSSRNRGTKSASGDGPQIVTRKDKRRGKKVRKSKRSHGSKVRKSKDSLTVPSLGAKMEELKISKEEGTKISASTQQGAMGEKPKRGPNNPEALESFFRSLSHLCGGGEPLIFTSDDPAFVWRYHDLSEDDSDDDSSSPGCHKVEEWIPVDRYAWRPRPQIDPKWGPCTAANAGDN